MSQPGGQQVLVVPVLIETCDIPPLLSDRLYADVREDFEKGFFKILDAIRLHKDNIASQPAQGTEEDQSQVYA
jgi:hypothetical protein